MDLPESLLNQACKVIGVKTKTQAIVMALTEAIQRRKSRDILKLKGTLAADYDYKSLRRKR